MQNKYRILPSFDLHRCALAVHVSLIFVERHQRVELLGRVRCLASHERGRLWVTCIAAVMFAIVIGASFPWGYVILAIVAAVVAFQMGRKVGRDSVWTLFINKRSEKPRRSSSRSLIASDRTRARSASR